MFQNAVENVLHEDAHSLLFLELDLRQLDGLIEHEVAIALLPAVLQQLDHYEVDILEVHFSFGRKLAGSGFFDFYLYLIEHVVIFWPVDVVPVVDGLKRVIHRFLNDALIEIALPAQAVDDARNHFNLDAVDLLRILDGHSLFVCESDQIVVVNLNCNGALFFDILLFPEGLLFLVFDADIAGAEGNVIFVVLRVNFHQDSGVELHVQDVVELQLDSWLLLSFSNRH